MARQPRRPVSPHLQIYRPQLTSVLSIAHRLTGLFLFFAACVWTVFLGALSGAGFSFLETGWGRILGFLFLVSFLGALFYHLLNGVRHLAWDLGYGFDLSRVHQSGKAVLGGTVLLTGIALWRLL